MMTFIIKHSYISGISVGLISFPAYLIFFTKTLMFMIFGQTQASQVCGMAGVLVMIILLFSMGVSFIISILNGIYISKYLNSLGQYQLK